MVPPWWSLPHAIRQDCGKVLQRLDGARQWWMGDWWNAGVQWGEGKSACEEFGFTYQTVADAGMVARAIEFGRRRQNLSFSHHLEVSKLDDSAVQDRFLDWCEEPIETTGEPRLHNRGQVWYGHGH